MNNIILEITDDTINNLKIPKIFGNALDDIVYKHMVDILRLSKNREDGHQYDEVGRLLNIYNGDYADVYGECNKSRVRKQII